MIDGDRLVVSHYTFLASNLIVVSDINGGLFVLEDTGS